MFSFLLYYLVLIPISLLPFPVLQGLSTLLYYLLFHVFGYRKKVVYENLKKSFPDKTAKEIHQIAKAFYRHFSDLLLEGFKAFTISDQILKKHLYVKNPELMERYYKEGKSVIITVGHYNSWEFFLTGIQGLIPHKAAVIYQPLSNSFLNKKVCQTRSNHGSTMLATHEVKAFFTKVETEPSAVVFAIDQSPSDAGRCYWMEFLNQETGVLYGAEKFAREYDRPVLYLRINKESRGYFSMEFFEVENHSKESPYGSITERTARLLEQDILHTPQYWLWTHRRWKHKRPSGHVNIEKRK